MTPAECFILIGCEESQATCLAFRKLGFQAFSCDLKPCSGGHPEWHMQMDVFEAVASRHWHAAIFHPDCTYLTVSGLHWNGRIEGRSDKTMEAVAFVKRLMLVDIKHVAIENPVGCISTFLKPANQYIQPYDFGDDASKNTGRWLKNLPLLRSTGYFPPRYVDGKPRWSNQTDSGQNKLAPSATRAEERSKTYPGIADAFADQWGKYIIESAGFNFDLFENY